jgi:hypothetical protein
MKTKITLAFIGVFALVAMSVKTFANDIGYAGATGAYAEGDCTACHASYAVNSGPGSITITSTPSLAGGYAAGTKYTVTVTVANTGMVDFGFDFEALTNATTNGGTLAIMTDTTDDQIMANGSLNDVTHTLTGISGNGTKSFSFYWTAPATGSSTVTFYAAGVANNQTAHATGAYVYTDSLVIKNTTGIEANVAKDFNLSVYPNPSSNNLYVNFSLNGASSVNMDMIDITGRKVAELISENEMNGVINKTFDVSSLTKGIYFIRLKINDQLTVKKIVVE